MRDHRLDVREISLRFSVGVGGVWVDLLGNQGSHTRFILVLREFILNTSAVSLVLAISDDTGSLGSPPRQVVYSPV